MWHSTLPLVALLALARPSDPKAAGRSVQQAGSGQVTAGQPPLVASVIAALDKMVNYYEQNHHLLNLDGVFGAKAIEGQLNLLVAKHNKGLLSDAVDYLMKNELSQMATRAGRVVRMSLPHLHKSQPVSMHRLRRLFQLSWDIGHSHRKVDLTLLWDTTTKTQAAHHSLTESETNRCLGEVLEPTNGVVCAMSQWCQQVMTQAGQSHYALTHQILYSIVAEMSGCGSRLEQWVVKHQRTGSLEQLQAEMCANLYVEACALPTLAHSDPKPARVWDLFLEMEFVCGMLGYSQFLQESWLRRILALQDPSGCFKVTPASTPAPTSVYTPVPLVNTNTSPPHRKLLSEIVLPDGCLAHLTAVAGSSLAVHLHSLLYTGQSESLPVSAPRTHPPPPPLYLQPPQDPYPLPIGSSFMINKPIFRGDIHSGLNRVAEQEKSLEDKADLLLQQIEAENTHAKETHKKETNRKRKIDKNKNKNTNSKANSNAVSPRHSRRLALPEMALPFTFTALGSVPVPASPSEPPSPAPLFLLAGSVVVVAVGLARYVHAAARRRRCNLVVGLKGKFRL